MSTPQPVDPDPALRRWQRTYTAAAKDDRYTYLLEQHGFDRDAPDAEQQGSALLQGLIDAVTQAAELRAHFGRPSLDWFLAWQRYGTEPAAGFSVRYGPFPDVELFVDRVDDLDLEELFEPRPLGYLCIRALHGKLTRAAARSIARHVKGDLEFGGDEVELSWTHEGAAVDFQVRI